MLFLQSGSKVDLENNRSVFVLYMSNESDIYNCTADYALIKEADDANKLTTVLTAMVKSLAEALFAKKEEPKEPEPAEDNKEMSDDELANKLEKTLNPAAQSSDHASHGSRVKSAE